MVRGDEGRLIARILLDERETIRDGQTAQLALIAEAVVRLQSEAVAAVCPERRVVGREDLAKARVRLARLDGERDGGTTDGLPMKQDMHRVFACIRQVVPDVVRRQTALGCLSEP